MITGIKRNTNGLFESKHYILDIRPASASAQRLRKYLERNYSDIVPFKNEGSDWGEAVNSLVELRSRFKHGTWRRFIVDQHQDGIIELGDEITQGVKELDESVGYIFVFNKHDYILANGMQHSRKTADERTALMDSYITDTIKGYNHIAKDETYQAILSAKQSDLVEVVDFLDFTTKNQLEEDILKELKVVDPEVDELVSYAVNNAEINDTK